MSDMIKLFESIIGKKPDAFLHEPVYQVTESEVAEFARAILAQEAGKVEPVMKLEAERLWEGDGEYWVSFVKSGWLDECRETGGTFLLYTSPPAPVAVVLPIDIQQRLNDVWLFLDGQTELNGCVWGEKPEGRHQFWWRKELRSVVEDLNACLDKVKELNQ